MTDSFLSIEAAFLADDERMALARQRAPVAEASVDAPPTSRSRARTAPPRAAGPFSDILDTPAPPPPPPPSRPLGGRDRPRPRRPRRSAAILLLTLAAALVLVAVGVGGYPFYTDIMASRHQKTLRAQLAQQSALSGAERNRLLQEYRDRNFAIGSPITRLTIPKLGVDTVVVEGTSDEALAVGAGHYPQSPLPGDAGNVAIAGHRTMNGHPFGDLDKLAAGDQIVLRTPFATYTYQVVPPFQGHADPWVTTPEDWSVISFPTQDHLLTLTTCNPKGQKTQRLIARAQLVSSKNVST